MNIWDNPTLEEQRDLKRKKYGRIAFDCYNLKLKVEGDRVFCAKGHLLGRVKDKGLKLTAILRGITPSVCRSCWDFDGGGNEAQKAEQTTESA